MDLVIYCDEEGGYVTNWTDWRSFPPDYFELKSLITKLDVREITRVAYLESLPWGAAYLLVAGNLMIKALVMSLKAVGGLSRGRSNPAAQLWRSSYRELLNCFSYWSSFWFKPENSALEIPELCKEESLRWLRECF